VTAARQDGVVNPKTASRLAWGSAGLATTLQLTALALLLVALSSPVDLPAGLQLTAGTPIAFVGFLVYPLVGGLIAARRPANPVGWLLLAFSSGVGLTNATYLYSVLGLIVSPTPLPGAEVAARTDAWLWIVGLCPLAAAILLYPSGRLPSPRWRWPLRSCLVPVVLGLGVGISNWGEPGRRLLLAEELPPRPARVFEAVVVPALLVLILIGVAALIVRFRRGSWEERQQIKWVVLSSTCLLLSGLIVTALPRLLPSLLEELLSIAAFMAVPISIAIAILRHRLYDIDRIINRALVYTVVTVILSAAYGLISVAGVALGSGFDVFRSDLAVAGATLAVAAAFRPLRRRTQSFVDRRFYRSRYDAGRTVEGFSARLRDEVDLDSLTRDLLATVNRTLRPEYASVVVAQAGGHPS
jgi:hypothetical protein